ncbi:MAG: phospholipase D family protein [Sphingomonadaceae bacterium]|uniref:phospholipase D family protein n=1 Tax=Thermaurantiacus sp. TaxID=2820283 RepID=UPI00298F3D5A|nr:phospholipase D family protein [Thermaurantiacus sp.]MCS6987879.1 phospholipase D family protein [Sphingomonadaceae bacterium]MDW8414901.1 phospholipase D family protein [Thermaurantiacus sp.]
MTVELWLVAALAAAWALLAHGLKIPSPPPPDPPRPPPDRQAPLVRWAEASAEADRSGVALLADPLQAFAVRVAIIRSARSSLDLQTYIWRPDRAGAILLAELQAAARRGVAVRLLIDDHGTQGLDAALAALLGEPGVRIRLFNPFLIRRPRAINYLLHPRRLNRRMHNKALVADGSVAVAGGRNVGDEYFGAERKGAFVDLDLMLVGPAARELAADFERYWHARVAVPAERLLRSRRPLWAAAAPTWPEAYTQALSALPTVEGVPHLPLKQVPVRLVSDDPAKAEQRAPPERRLGPQLLGLLGAPRREVLLVSPYFVPTAQGAAALAALARQGVRVTVLTNSLDATNHWVVHAGYARRRRALLAAGVRLFELKGPRAAGPSPRRLRLIRPPRPEGRFLVGPQATALHAKTFAIDRHRLFVGSFNFDPRSVHLNTELGFLAEAPELAAELHDGIEALVAEGLAYELVLEAGGRLAWLERTPAGPRRRYREPGATRLQRLAVGVLSPLPIEWLL